ncbi:MAG: MaoC family dehydratase [Alphaproteobacteria bacterium]|nr:MAG: MaoC family dehydratase [Alphaproteobacteria bacterium]
MSQIHGYYLEDLEIGQTASLTRTVTEEAIEQFAEISGDTNPLHLDEDYARTTPFAGRIAHGALSASYISAVLGTDLPGPGCIYLSKSLRFRAPVRIGDEVTARVTVKAINLEKRRVTFDCVCEVGGKVVLDGEALIMVDSRNG